MKNHRPSAPLWIAISLIGILLPASGVDLQYPVLSAGGGLSTTGRFQVQGSIGQPIAHTDDTLTPSLSVRAGFWAQVARWFNSAPVANEDVIQRRPGQGAHVLIRFLLSNDVGTDREGLEFVAAEELSTGGGRIYREGPWIIYEPSSVASPTDEDSFEYTVRDALGVLTTGTVRVVIAGIPPGGPPNSLQVELVPGNPPLVSVRFHGVANRRYAVQTTSDVAGTWSSLEFLVAGSDGSIFHTEPLSTGPRYYRIIEPNGP